MLGRETSAEVVLISRLRPALTKLNPRLFTTAIEIAIDELTCERASVGMMHANHEIYNLLKDGAKVLFRDEDGTERVETVRVLDWRHPFEMDFYEQFQKLIAEYNSGADNADAFFAQLVTFAQSLNEEEKRSVSENLNEEELALLTF